MVSLPARGLGTEKPPLSIVTLSIEMDRLQGLADEGLRRTLLYARSQPHPVTADDVADAHSVHRNVARGRLERLAHAGLLIPAFERRTTRSGPGAGRPAKTYRVAPELTALELPPRRYEQLIALMIEQLPLRERKQRLREIGISFGRRLADELGLRPRQTLAKALARVCAALGTAGFQASVAELADDSAVLSTPTCPLRPLVTTTPEATEIDRGMWEALVRASLPGSPRCDVSCETAQCHLGDEPCRIRVQVSAAQ